MNQAVTDISDLLDAIVAEDTDRAVAAYRKLGYRDAESVCWLLLDLNEAAEWMFSRLEAGEVTSDVAARYFENVFNGDGGLIETLELATKWDYREVASEVRGISASERRTPEEKEAARAYLAEMERRDKSDPPKGYITREYCGAITISQASFNRIAEEERREARELFDALKRHFDPEDGEKPGPFPDKCRKTFDIVGVGENRDSPEVPSGTRLTQELFGEKGVPLNTYGLDEGLGEIRSPKVRVAMTDEEACRDFIQAIVVMAHELAKTPGDTEFDSLMGMAHSILAMIDGVHGGQPAFDLIADDPDHEYEYPKGSFNRSGGLHERLYRVAEGMGLWPEKRS